MSKLEETVVFRQRYKVSSSAIVTVQDKQTKLRS